MRSPITPPNPPEIPPITILPNPAGSLLMKCTADVAMIARTVAPIRLANNKSRCSLVLNKFLVRSAAVTNNGVLEILPASGLSVPHPICKRTSQSNKKRGTPGQECLFSAAGRRIFTWGLTAKLGGCIRACESCFAICGSVG